jgi:uroporphyrinogen-III synthase
LKVWVTRDEPVDGPLGRALRDAGLEAVHEPVIEKHIHHQATGDIGRLGPDDWLVLTSPYAIEAVMTIAADAARVPRVAVVAESSRRVAETHGLRVKLVSPGGDSASLFDELRRRATGGHVCYARSSLAEVPQGWSGVTLQCPVLYETGPRAFDRAVIGRVDVIAVASPSAVQAIGPVDLPFASIGPTTSAALRQIGLEPWVEASVPSFESLAEAIAAGEREG